MPRVETERSGDKRVVADRASMADNGEHDL